MTFIIIINNVSYVFSNVYVQIHVILINNFEKIHIEN